MLTAEERKAIVDGLVPSSKGMIAVKLRQSHTLPNGEPFDHVILKRLLIFFDEGFIKRNPELFPKGSIVNTVQLFFSSGLDNATSCNYELEYRLAPDGNIIYFNEIRFTQDPDGWKTGMPTLHRPDQEEGWQYEHDLEVTDGFLTLLKSPRELLPVPPDHWLRHIKYKLQVVSP